MNKVMYLLILITTCLIGCIPPDQQKQPIDSCECPIEKSKDNENGRLQSKSENSWVVEGEIETKVKKVLELKIKLSGKKNISKTQIEETYWEILGDNRQLTQFANLYRIVACTSYKIICQDTSLSSHEKRKELSKMVNDFKENIEEIIKESKGKSEEKNTLTTNTNTPESKEKNAIVLSPKKYVFVTLIVDAIYSDADIFANGTRLLPIENSLTVKKLKIPYEEQEITLLVKSPQNACEKTLPLLSAEYFDNPSNIVVTCVE